MSTELVIEEGSVEYLYADVTSDRSLDSQPVKIGVGEDLHAVTWHDATWIGDAGQARSARLLLDGTLQAGKYNVFVRVTDTPEEPIVKAGVLRIKVN